MAKITRSISTFVMVVVFLVLAAISITGSDNTKDKQLNDGELQNIKEFVNNGMVFAKKIINFNLKNNVGIGDKIKKEMDVIEMDNSKRGPKLSDLESVDKIKDYIQTELSNKESSYGENKLFSWERDKENGRFIITLENGKKISLPSLFK